MKNAYISLASERESMILSAIDHDLAYLSHAGVPNMHWYQHKFGKWQNHAVYAQGMPNPDAVSEARQRMNTIHKPHSWDATDKGMMKYPKQTLSDLVKRDTKMSSAIRLNLNHPSSEHVRHYGAGRHYNCPNCASAFDMAYRGYDVIARPAKNGSNVGDIEKFYVGGKLQHTGGEVDTAKMSNLYDVYDKAYDKWISYKEDNITKYKAFFKNKEEAEKRYDEALTDLRMQAADNTLASISKQPKGSRGIIVVGWLDDPKFNEPTTFYHAFNYVNGKDGVKFYDVQSGKKSNYDGISAKDSKKDFFLDIDPREVYIMRTDNLQPSPLITQAVYSPNRSKK